MNDEFGVTETLQERKKIHGTSKGEKINSRTMSLTLSFSPFDILTIVISNKSWSIQRWNQIVFNFSLRLIELASVSIFFVG